MAERLTKQDIPTYLLDSYITTLNKLGKDEVWGEEALNMKPMSSWEKYKGFGLFREPSFIKQIDSKLEGHIMLTPDTVLQIEQEDMDALTAEIKLIKQDLETLKQEGVDTSKLSGLEQRVNTQLSKILEIMPKLEKIVAEFDKKPTLDNQIIQYIEGSINKNLKMYDLIIKQYIEEQKGE